MDIKIFVRQSPEYEQALVLRRRILREPLGLEFTEAELKKDEEDIHFGLFENGKILACLTLTKMSAGRIKMRQVAVDFSSQRKGLGSELSTAAENFAKANGFNIMFCHARKEAVPFYKMLGYEIVGDEFTEVNIPHYAMEKQL